MPPAGVLFSKVDLMSSHERPPRPAGRDSLRRSLEAGRRISASAIVGSAVKPKTDKPAELPTAIPDRPFLGIAVHVGKDFHDTLGPQLNAEDVDTAAKELAKAAAGNAVNAKAIERKMNRVCKCGSGRKRKNCCR